MASALAISAAQACGDAAETEPSGSGAASATSGSGGAQGGGGATTAPASSGPGDLKEASQSCVDDAQCVSGQCLDQVCCADACDAPCSSCLGEITGLPNGSCGTVADDTDPHGDCSDGATCSSGVCCGGKPTPPGGTCPAECTGGCSNGTCTIDCGLQTSCEFDQVICPPGFACFVRCQGSFACRNADIQCPDTYACDVECDASNNSCRNLQLECGSGSCSVSCLSGSTCDGSDVQCGDGACAATCPQAGQGPDLHCNQACSCQAC